MVWEADFLASLQNIRSPFLDKVTEYLSMLGDHGIFCINEGLLLRILVYFRLFPILEKQFGKLKARKKKA